MIMNEEPIRNLITLVDRYTCYPKICSKNLLNDDVDDRFAYLMITNLRADKKEDKSYKSIQVHIGRQYRRLVSHNEFAKISVFHGRLPY